MNNKILVDAVAVDTGATHNSTVENFHMPKGNRGLAAFKVASYAGSGNVAFKLEGRTNSNMDWATVSNTGVNIASSITTYVEDVQLYPEMRAVVTAAAGVTAATVSVHVGG
tara:strand:- start:396 stop:728 length:333 start_codon:yes stop_codon:yes gene_type:complete